MDIDIIRGLLPKLSTPSYIFDADVFEERARLVKRYFGEKIGICFSIKANAFLLGKLPEIFNKIEVCSPGELTICEKTGADMEKVIFSGVNKGAEDVARAMDDGVGVFTAESLLHMTLINDAAKARGRRVPVLLRLTAGSQFGMDEDEVLDIIRNRARYEGAELVGLHFFSGTQKRKAKAIVKELDYLEEFCGRVREEAGFAIRRVEYGTGLAADYFTDDADRLEEERLAEVSERLRAFAEKYELTVEMGRFFAAPCGYYLTKVVDVKTNRGVRYAILDGGLHQLKYDGQLQGMQIPQIFHIHGQEKTESRPEKWTLCGSLCTTADVIAREAEFSGLSVGDTLVFCRTGAYSAMEGMALFLSRELPVISLYSEQDGLKIVREMIRADGFNTPGSMEKG